MAEGVVKYTPEQNNAISMKGNILVSAAAGAGKTRVLVERIVRLIVSGKTSLDKLLVVTFTDKAANEMKDRIRNTLSAKLDSDTGNQRLQREFMLLDRAQISTIHSFCLKILKRYYYKLGLDPSFRVLDQYEAELMRLDSLEEVLEKWYEKDPGDNWAFNNLVRGFGGKGVDLGLQQLILKLHEFSKTHTSPEKWLDSCVKCTR